MANIRGGITLQCDLLYNEIIFLDNEISWFGVDFNCKKISAHFNNIILSNFFPAGKLAVMSMKTVTMMGFVLSMNTNAAENEGGLGKKEETPVGEPEWGCHSTE